MTAKNNKEVTAAIVHFSVYLLISTVLAVGMYSSFMKTSVVEIRKILKKSGYYDALQMKQVVLTESVDSIYYYAMLINSDDLFVNQSSMYNMLSARILRFSEGLETVGSDDCPVYRKLSVKLGDFLQLKDSIRMAQLQVDVLRDEYVRCINKNKDMTRRLFTGSVY
jgi:hypothetical protein